MIKVFIMMMIIMVRDREREIWENLWQRQTTATHQSYIFFYDDDVLTNKQTVTYLISTDVILLIMMMMMKMIQENCSPGNKYKTRKKNLENTHTQAPMENEKIFLFPWVWHHSVERNNSSNNEFWNQEKKSQTKSQWLMSDSKIAKNYLLNGW